MTLYLTYNFTSGKNWLIYQTYNVTTFLDAASNN